MTRRFDVIAPDLIDPERDSFVFSRVLTLDHQHREAVDEKDQVFARTVAPVVIVELFRDFVDIAPIAVGSSQIAIVDQRDVQLAIVFRGEKLVLIAQRRQKVPVTVDVGMKSLELTHQRTLGFFVFWIESANLGMQQIAEEQRGFLRSFRNSPRPVLGERARVRGEAPPPLSLFARDEGPTDLLGVG